MLWSALSVSCKAYLMSGCLVVLGISLVFVVCFLLPDGWSLCPTEGSDYDPRQDAFIDDCNLVISSGQAEKYRPTPDDALNGTERGDRDVKRIRMSDSSSSSVFSSDSGRPGSSGVGSSGSVMSGISSDLSRRTSLAMTAPSDLEAALQSESSDNRPPRIHLKMQRNPRRDETEQQFALIIERATDLPRRTYVDTVDPTVIVRLERRNKSSGFVNALKASFRSQKENELLVLDASCPIAYRSRSPAFNHLVQLDVPNSVDIKDCQIVLRVEDRDKLVGTSEICNCRIDFLDIYNASMNCEDAVTLTRDLTPFNCDKKNEKGDVLLGLSFLPTSQRITVRITRFERLPKSCEVGLAIVRLFVLNESGRVIKKRKTAPRAYSTDGRLEFDEQFAIEVDAERWQGSVLLIVLSRIIELQHAGRAPPVYEHVGHVAIGRRVACVSERIHWNSALQMPRRVVSQWHHLH